MWVLVMFDLPVVEKADQKAAATFRNSLLDLGFEMAQYSVYMRFCTSQAEADSLGKKVEDALPEGGKVNVLGFTDRQYERIRTYFGRRRQKVQKVSPQFSLF